MDEPVDFNRLVEEATREGYDPRARRCWPWSHRWTMWVLDPTGLVQTRRCTACGRSQRHVLATRCTHQWQTTHSGPLMSGERRTGTYFMQECRMCHDIRRLDKFA